VSKSQKVLALMLRPNGATMKELLRSIGGKDPHDFQNAVWPVRNRLGYEVYKKAPNGEGEPRWFAKAGKKTKPVKAKSTKAKATKKKTVVAKPKKIKKPAAIKKPAVVVEPMTMPTPAE
jgi:hypothetical protein